MTIETSNGKNILVIRWMHVVAVLVGWIVTIVVPVTIVVATLRSEVTENTRRITAIENRTYMTRDEFVLLYKDAVERVERLEKQHDAEEEANRRFLRGTQK